MDKQSDGGLAVTLAAVCAAIAGAVTRHLVARLWRAPSKREDDIMCRNHSHVQGRIYSLTDEDGVTVVKMLVTQPLTVEVTNGSKLTLPVYCTCYVRVPPRDASWASRLQEMAAQGEPALFKDEPLSTSGPTTPTK